MRRELELGGEWELKPVERFDGGYEPGWWRRQEIPGHWQELEEFKNYSGRMVYRKKFSFNPEPGRRYWLKLNGVFYWCAAYLNGFRAGVNQGYFIPACLDITDAIKSGENELILEVSCFAEPDKLHKKQLLGVWHHWDCLYRDWNPGGIWQPAQILSSGPVAIFEPMFHTVFLHPDYARISGQLRLESEGREEMELKINLTPHNHNGQGFEQVWTVHKNSGSSEYQYGLNLKDYRLWWSWDQGEQNLYRLRVEVRRQGDAEPSDSYETLFGVRTFQLRDYSAYLNGRRIWLKGSNYPPGDYKIRAMTRERYQKDFQLAKDAHMNILRVHAHVEKPEFYEEADQAGILLWQDFAMQWAYDRSVLPEALYQSEQMLKLLYNHPAIVIWCMHNEPIKQWDTARRPRPADLARLAYSVIVHSWDREVMDKQLSKQAQYLDPHRPAIPSAGERGFFRKDSGTGHYYFGWYFGPLDFMNWLVAKRPHRLKLVDEFGSQSFPNYENAVKFMPGQLEKLDWEELEKKFLAQPNYLEKFIPRKNFSDLKGYIQATQDYQSIVNRYHIDRLRSLKYRPCGGVLTFDFQDPNPAVTWSVLDYERTPKSSFHELKKAFSPVYAFALLNHAPYKLNRKLAIPIFAVNDLNRKIQAQLSARLVSPMKEQLFEQKLELKLDADCPAQAVLNPMLELRWPGEYRLELNLAWNESTLQNIYQIQVK